MESYLYGAHTPRAGARVAVRLLPARGGGRGGIFGQQTGVYRTKRGIEKTLFRFTIVLMVIFVIISILAVQASG